MKFIGLGVKLSVLGVRVTGLGVKLSGLGVRATGLGVKLVGLGVRAIGLRGPSLCCCLLEYKGHKQITPIKTDSVLN